MFSYILSLFNFNFFSKNDDDDISKEDYLAEQLVELEATQPNEVNDVENATEEIPRNAVCFQRTGVITYINEEKTFILIDGNFYFDCSNTSIYLNTNDKVLYLGYKNSSDTIVVVRILDNFGTSWGDDEDRDENTFSLIEHTIIGEVDYREERLVIMKDVDWKFSLDEVEGSFVPVKGDWLELKCTVQWNENKPSDISAAQVVKVLFFKPLRLKLTEAVVTDWFGDFGACNRQLYFNKASLQDAAFTPNIGTKVFVEAIESNQGRWVWRVIKLVVLDKNIPRDAISFKTVDDINLELEKEKNLVITFPLKFSDVKFNETAKIVLDISNNNNELYIINKWIILSKKRDSQLDITPFLAKPVKLYPKQKCSFQIKCIPKFLGNSRECLIIMFRGFQIKRYIEINVVDNNVLPLNINNDIMLSSNKTEYERIQQMKQVRLKDKAYLPGVRVVKPPAFIPVKIGVFSIPEKIWSAVLGDSEQTILSPDYDKIIDRIERRLPCLSGDLNINNYIDKWHTLLYMEEVQLNISMRSHDIGKAFLIRIQEYLCIEIKGLAERRPSLMKGDRVIVKDLWRDDRPNYEGFIHVIRGDLILMKFNLRFHENYSGSDVSLEFHFSRVTYRKFHQAVNLAISNLGSDILFPSRVLSRPPKISQDKINSIKWYNESLNDNQKAAVINTLLGFSRPMPYCIYGPPGTGKTVTVTEAILQILTNMPDSRILVATPSNSAANLITERLLQYRNVFSDSLIRVIANYLLESDNLPDSIKPFCATFDIGTENSVKDRHEVTKEGVNINCRKTFIGRHRVTIGTCACVGTLAVIGLPKGHFTHVIVDEAGQATEPEIMVPMTFIDKENGQIVIAGDPMQLGPVVLSKYCSEFGMGESYLSRVLDTFPYQKDYDAFVDGFNPKLVTRLINNYRSLKEVLKVPNDMFYDGSLVAKINGNEEWIMRMVEIVNDIFDRTDSKTGGIYVYGIKGRNARAVDSPSWYNPQEATMLALTVCKLFKKNISIDDIGIITPYLAQTKYIRALFESMGLPLPKIGTVEEFQGQERPIILISTVRSTESYLPEDQKHSLGFVKNPKRLNVAITRAQVAAILFCDPHLLSLDPLWNTVLQYSVNQNTYMGCDLPQRLQAN